MSTPSTDLINTLQATDMLEIDELHAWQFDLDETQLEQHQAGHSNDSDAPLLLIECMDGRTLRKWKFTLAQVQTAQYQADTDTWLINSNDGQHQLKCFEAFSGDNDDEEDGGEN